MADNEACRMANALRGHIERHCVMEEPHGFAPLTTLQCHIWEKVLPALPVCKCTEAYDKNQTSLSNPFLEAMYVQPVASCSLAIGPVVDENLLSATPQRAPTQGLIGFDVASNHLQDRAVLHRLEDNI